MMVFICRLKMNPETGVIILKESGALDRESVAEHYLTAEARDDLGRGNRLGRECISQGL